MFHLNIRGKLFLGFGSIFLVIIIVLSTIDYRRMVNNLEEMAQYRLETITKNIYNVAKISTESSVKSYLRAIAERSRLLVEFYYKQFQDGVISEEAALEKIRNFLLDKKYGKIGKTGYIAGVSAKGVLTIHPKSEGVDASQFEFMQRAVKQKNGYLEYMWKNKGEEVERAKAGWISYFEPLDLIIWASSYKDEFNFLAGLDDIKKYISQIKIGETGYPYIFTSKGDMLIHPYLEGSNMLNVLDENGEPFVKEMIKKKDGWIRYSWKKTDSDQVSMKLVFFKYYQEMDWIIASGIYEDELYAPLNNQRVLYLSLFTLSVALVILVILLLSSSFTRPIKSIVSLLEKSAQGDLTKRLPPRKKDEIGKIIDITNEFLDTLHMMASDIKSTVTHLKTSTTDLTGISQEIYTTANEQAAAVSEVVATAEEFAAISKQIAMNASGVAQVAMKTEKDVEKGAGNVNTTLNKMKSIKASNERNINEISKLMKKVEQINDVLKFINTIADQTKILAFNAALEASSSEGDSGKRFNIVAVEIRRLAERIVEKIADIEDMINEIKRATHELIISFEQSSVRIAEGFKQAEETSQVLITIQMSSKQTSKSARQIDSGTSQQQIASDQIVTTLKEISDGIQQFVGATKHSDDITKQINELSDKFNKTISRFQLISEDE